MATFGEEVQKIKMKMDRPIPGSSLTSDPENPAPYEKPPRITSVHQASEFIWLKLINPEVYVPLMDAVEDGMPVMKITRLLLFKEFSEGTFNPDLMLLLIEPTAYMIIALAERLELDIVIDGNDEDDDLFGIKIKQKQIEELEATVNTGKKIPTQFVSPEMKIDMEKLPEIPERKEEESLLSAPEQTQDPESLMSKR
jgi:hypothetical protein